MKIKEKVKLDYTALALFGFCHQHQVFCWRDKLVGRMPKHGGVYLQIGQLVVDIPGITYPEKLDHEYCDHKYSSRLNKNKPDCEARLDGLYTSLFLSRSSARS